MAGIVAPGLRALLRNLIDYAGTFPPASLTCDAAIANYKSYWSGEHAWMLGRFVVSITELDEMPAKLDGSFAVLSDADHPRAAAIESKKIISTSKPSYCEAAIQQLDEVKKAGSFAKVRTGGVTPDAIPSPESVASYIFACAERQLPFKATAGLHHPVREVHRLTYEPDATPATMHGFVNVFLAAAFAWHGERQIEPILAETDVSAFHFDERAHWRKLSLSSNEIAEARSRFAHSFGSCSFEEPIEELQALKWL
ncbi:MAG: hypothetical protein ACJ74Z_02310 [Bryobacteraceae bacterium]